MKQTQKNLEKLENKLVKYYWTDCLDPFSGELLLGDVDNSEDFSCIPLDGKGNIKDFGIGCLREIVKETIKQCQIYIKETLAEEIQKAREEERDRINKLVPQEKPMNVFSFVLEGEELEMYMRHKGWNECRSAFKTTFSQDLPITNK